MTPDQIKASLSMLDDLDRPGTDASIKGVVSLALSMKAPTPLTGTQLNVWVAKLRGFPLVAITEVADAVIETPGPFAADLGTFLSMVRGKAKRNDALRSALTFKPIKIRPIERSDPPELGSFPRPNAKLFREPALLPRNEERLKLMKAKILGKKP